MSKWDFRWIVKPSDCTNEASRPTVIPAHKGTGGESMDNMDGQEGAYIPGCSASNHPVDIGGRDMSRVHSCRCSWSWWCGNRHGHEILVGAERHRGVCSDEIAFLG